MALIVFYDSSNTDKPQLEHGLKDTDHTWVFIEEPISEDNINPEAEVISVFVTSTVTSAMIDKMPNLKLIAARSTGYNTIDLEHAVSKGITVTNVPSYGENTVAEHVFLLLLAVARKFPATLERTHDGTYEATEFTGLDLKGKTLGVVGMGRIGQHSARIAKGFGMRVIGYDMKQLPEVAEEIGYEYGSLEEVLSQSDFLTLHAPLLADNVHLINAETIAQMKPGAILINTARGELVNNQDLLDALDSGHLGGAGLDTIEGERYLDEEADWDALSNDNTDPEDFRKMAEIERLLHLPNVVVTPHSAYNTAEAIARINQTTTDNIISYWYGETPNAVLPRK